MNLYEYKIYKKGTQIYVCIQVAKNMYVIILEKLIMLLLLFVCFQFMFFFIEALFQMKTTDIMSDTIRVKFYFTYKMSSFGIIF